MREHQKNTTSAGRGLWFSASVLGLFLRLTHNSPHLVMVGCNGGRSAEYTRSISLRPCRTRHSGPGQRDSVLGVFVSFYLPPVSCLIQHSTLSHSTSPDPHMKSRPKLTLDHSHLPTRLPWDRRGSPRGDGQINILPISLPLTPPAHSCSAAAQTIERMCALMPSPLSESAPLALNVGGAGSGYRARRRRWWRRAGCWGGKRTLVSYGFVDAQSVVRVQLVAVHEADR